MSSPPKYLSSDHDPLYRFHQWRANLRILDVKDIKTVPYVPLSHPFVERLIGTIRRECLDCTLFWTAADLEMKLLDFQRYYNRHRTHARSQAPTRTVDARMSSRINGSRTAAGYIRRRWRRDMRTTDFRRCTWAASETRLNRCRHVLSACVNLAGVRIRAESPQRELFQGRLQSAFWNSPSTGPNGARITPPRTRTYRAAAPPRSDPQR